MYETEVNGRREAADAVPSPVLAHFREWNRAVVGRTVLPWGEHCTECVWPTCYSSCDLYTPREDGKCRRFVEGMVRVDAPGSLNSYLVKIAFKQWGKLWTAANVHLVPPARARSLEQWDDRIGQTLYQIALPRSLKRVATWRRYDYKKKRALSRAPSAEHPDAFVVECYNPGAGRIDLSLTMRAVDDGRPVPYQQLIALEPGYTRAVVPFDDIVRVLDVAAPFTVELIPNAVPDGTTLYFGALDFVRGPGITAFPAAATPARAGTNGRPDTTKVKTVKCVVWDLDNTLWNGILVEEGGDALALKPDLADVIRALDARGILQSVASKNNADDALAVLTRLGVQEYFLYPDISWGPKSEAVKRIARRLNIGLDTLLFIDDSEFERAEVSAACPEVRVLDAVAYRTVTGLPECQVPVTAEAAGRRQMYRTDSIRQTEAERFGEDYFAFLRDCRLEAHLRPLSPDNLQRVHELTQRTNQMNFSGNRYERRVLEQVMATPHLRTYVLDCRDRFGEYGVVGFCIVDDREPRITDLMFSCRVQSKRVEHALLRFVIDRHSSGGTRDVHADYRETPRNAPSGRVFADLGFERGPGADGQPSLLFPKGRRVSDDGIITVVLHPSDGEVAPAAGP